MALHVEKFAVAAPAGTSVIGSITTAVTFPPGVISAISVKIPGGHVRKTGLRIFFGEAQLIPRTLDQWLRGNKVTHRFEFDDPFPGGTGWFTEVFNTGAYTHTFELFLELDELATLTLVPPVILLRQSGETLPSPSPVNGAPPGPTPIPGVPGAQ